MKNVRLILGGKDYHGDGCCCGNCNSNGHSYAVEIVAVGESLDVEYAASEDAAKRNARLTCRNNGWHVVEDGDDE